MRTGIFIFLLLISYIVGFIGIVNHDELILGIGYGLMWMNIIIKIINDE